MYASCRTSSACNENSISDEFLDGFSAANGGMTLNITAASNERSQDAQRVPA
jgi:hypothetical protein